MDACYDTEAHSVFYRDSLSVRVHKAQEVVNTKRGSA